MIGFVSRGILYLTADDSIQCCCVDQVPLSPNNLSDSQSVTTPHSDAPFKVGVMLPRKTVGVVAALAVVFVLALIVVASGHDASGAGDQPDHTGSATETVFYFGGMSCVGLPACLPACLPFSLCGGSILVYGFQ